MTGLLDGNLQARSTPQPTPNWHNFLAAVALILAVMSADKDKERNHAF
jgi:hypothetical protein